MQSYYSFINSLFVIILAQNFALRPNLDVEVAANRERSEYGEVCSLNNFLTQRRRWAIFRPSKLEEYDKRIVIKQQKSSAGKAWNSRDGHVVACKYHRVVQT